MSVTFWSDSRIVLHWLNSESVSFKPFVGVRVAAIQSTWDPKYWRFVPTNLNPTDDLSQGISLEDIDGHWKNGPQGRGANQVSLSKHRRRSSQKEDKNNRSIKQSVTTDRSLTLLELAEAHKSHSVSSVLFTT